MLVTRDFRPSKPDVTITMSVREFRDHVEWLELLSPDDGATRDFRGWLDQIDPEEASGER